MTEREQEFLELYSKADDRTKQAVLYILNLDSMGLNCMLKETGIDLNNKHITEVDIDKILFYKDKRTIKEQLSLQDIQNLLGVSYKTALGYIQTGKLPAHRVGNKWKINRKDFEVFAYGE